MRLNCENTLQTKVAALTKSTTVLSSFVTGHVCVPGSCAVAFTHSLNHVAMYDKEGVNGRHFSCFLNKKLISRSTIHGRKEQCLVFTY
jgi:hypothetical protein